MLVKSICIVGGGSAGWMTAAAFSKQLKNVRITLIESPNVPTIGVGESTISEFNNFLDAIGVNDDFWMKECDATLKIGINFIDFSEKGKSFIYPFLRKDHITDPIEWLFYKTNIENFEYMLGDVITTEKILMAKKHKITDNISLEKFCINRSAGFNTHAYQLNAVKFAHFLKDKVAIPNGVNHILDDVIDFNVVDDKLRSVRTQSGLNVEADLFIDCTGFKSLLLEGVFKVKHSPYKHLINDSAFFVPISYTEESKEKELHVTTECTTIQNGWVWNIPLWSRIGSGYVYSSKYVDKDVAQLEFLEQLTKKYGNERVKNLTFKSLNTINGRHDDAWVSNVVALGLSYGFIEPLESTSLWYVHYAISKLVNLLQERDYHVGTVERFSFNREMNTSMDNTSWWVACHYLLSKRTDTQYWRDYIDKVEIPSNINRDFLNFLYRTLDHNYYAFHPASNFIAYGMGVHPKTKEQFKFDYNGFLDDYERLSNIVDTFPSHYEYLKNNIYK